MRAAARRAVRGGGRSGPGGVGGGNDGAHVLLGGRNRLRRGMGGGRSGFAGQESGKSTPDIVPERRGTASCGTCLETWYIRLKSDSE